MSHSAIGRSMANLWADSVGADPFVMDDRKIPDFIVWGNKLEKDKTIAEKVEQILNFGPGEVLRYHYHNVRGSSAFHLHHSSYHCAVVTNVRFANIADGKKENSIEFARMSRVVLAKKRGLLWDKVVVTLTDNTTTNISISTEEAAVFFCLLINRVLESRKQKLLDDKQKKILRMVKKVSQPEIIHDPAGHKSSMEYINTSISKHKRFEFLPDERIEVHCANLLRKVKLSTHAHLSTSNCIIKTNLRLIKMDQRNLVCAHPLSRIARVDLIPMHFLRFTRLHAHFFNGMTDTIRIGDLIAARFFARTLQNMILTRASESMEANKKHVSKASVKFDFDDNESFYIIAEVKGAQTLVLDHRETQTEAGSVMQLILSHITGQKSQKWIEYEGRIIPLLVYEHLKSGKTSCPSNIVDWVFHCHWQWKCYETCDAIVQVGHVLQDFYATEAVPPRSRKGATSGSKRDLQEGGQYLDEEKDKEPLWKVVPSASSSPPFLYDEQQPQPQLFLTIMGTCCQHPECERDSIVSGSFVHLAPPQHDKTGEAFLNKMQQFQRASDFEMFVDEMLNPLIENLTKFREAQNDRCDENLGLEFTTTFESLWGGNCYETPFSIWEPKRDQFKTVVFGHCCSFGANVPTLRMPIAKREFIGKLYQYPTSFELMWTYTPSKRLAKVLDPVYIWKPRHTNQDYVALGCICSVGPMPALNSVVCVHKSYLRLAASGSIHSLCVVDDSNDKQEEEENKYVPLFAISSSLLHGDSSAGQLNSSFVYQGLLRHSNVSPSEAEKASSGLVILTQDKLLCYEGEKAEGEHTEIQLTMTTSLLKQDSESKFFKIDALWFASKDAKDKGQWCAQVEAVLEGLQPTKSVVPWTLNNSLWYVDSLHTFWVVSGHKAPAWDVYRFKIMPAEVTEMENKMVAEGAQLLIQASNELLKLINQRTLEGDLNDTLVDEKVLSNTFFQITELLQVINNFLALVEKENLQVTSEISVSRMAKSQQNLNEAKDLIKRYIYRNVCRARLELKERLRRLNAVWPIIDLFVCSDWEVISFSYKLPLTEGDKAAIEAQASPGNPRPLRSLVMNVLRTDIKKHVERLWTPVASPIKENTSGSFLIPGFMIAEDETQVEPPKPKAIGDIVQQVQGEVKVAFQFLIELITSMQAIVPDLAVMCAEVIHVMIYTQLQENIEPRMLSVQAAVKLIEWLGQYETKMRKIVKSDPSVFLYILGQLSRLLDGYMDAYIAAGQAACLKWVRQILEREEKEPPALEAGTEGEKFYHGHGPYDLFINVNQVFDLAVNTHKFIGIALERQSEMLLQILTFYNQYQQRHLDRSFLISNVVEMDPEKPEKFLIAGRPYTHAWVLAQANDVSRYVELTEKFQETTHMYLSGPDKQVKMTAHLDDGFEALINSFKDTGMCYVDILKLFLDKYLRLACARLFTEAWFTDRESVWHQVTEDVERCLDKFVKGVESEVYCAVLIKHSIHYLVTFYFLSFIDNLKLIRAKCAVGESSATDFFEGIKRDKANFLAFWAPYCSLIEENRFKILATEVENLDLFQTMFECDQDFMGVHLETVQKRFGRNTHVTPTRVVTAILTLKEVPRPAIEALVGPWKSNDASAAGSKAAGGYDLIIRIEKGRNLAAKDSNGKSDPYCVVSLKDVHGFNLNSRQTQVIPENLDPVWNFTISGYTESTVTKFDSVLFEVYDKDFLSRDFMGQASLSFAEIQGHLLNNQWRTELFLAPRPEKKEEVSGSIFVTIIYGRKEQVEVMRQAQAKEEPPGLPEEKKVDKKDKKKLFTTFHFGASSRALSNEKPSGPEKPSGGGFLSVFKSKSDKTARTAAPEVLPPPVLEPASSEPTEPILPAPGDSEGDDEATMAKLREEAKQSHILQFKEARISSEITVNKEAEPATFFLDRRK